MTQQNIILYHTDCSRCKILKQKLDKKGIEYTIETDVDIIMKMGFKTVPILKINNEILDYLTAINWIKGVD